MITIISSFKIASKYDCTENQDAQSVNVAKSNYNFKHYGKRN